MRVNRKTLIFITLLILLVLILVVLKLSIGKKTTPFSPVETITPTPTVVSPTPIVCPLSETVREKLPYITDNYTVEYLPAPQKFFVMILGKPFEKYKAEAEKWLTSNKVEINSLCVSWASPKVP